MADPAKQKSPAKQAKEKPYFLIGSLKKGLEVLDLLAERQEVSVTDVAKALGLHRSAAHRFLATLAELGWVLHDSRSLYRLSFRVFEMGMRLVNAQEIKHLAQPILARLAQRHQETINLGRLVRDEIILIDRVESRQFLRIDLAVGTRVPAFYTALGKAVLAFRPEAEVKTLLAGLPKSGPTEKSLSDPAAFLAELKKIKTRGFALDNEELRPGMRCVAAPVFDFKGEALHALSISGPTSRVSEAMIPEISADVVQAARDLSAALGWNHY